MMDEGADFTYWERHNLDVCEDCIFLIVNGDGSEELAEKIEAEWPSAEGWSLSMGHEECEDCNNEEYGCEPWFSHRRCEACGSSYGGNRHHMTAMRQLDPLEVLAREGQWLKANEKQLPLL